MKSTTDAHGENESAAARATSPNDCERPPRPAQDAASNYRRRSNSWQSLLERYNKHFRIIGNLRLLTVVAGLALAWLALSRHALSAWLLLTPVIVFVVLIVLHEQVAQRQTRATRALAFYARGILRLTAQWAGHGNAGERFRDPSHVYAEDLDLFGAGSAFELLCTARTAEGEQVLADWLKAPSPPAAILARHHALRELLDGLDLREELALMGEDVRVGADSARLAHWAGEPEVHLFGGASVVAFVLAGGALLTFIAYLAHLVPLLPFLAAAMAGIIFIFGTQKAVQRIVEAVDTPARDLAVLSLMLARIERETFHSPALSALRERLMAGARPASIEIARLQKLLAWLDSAHNQFFRPIAFFLLWEAQFGLLIEKWRRRCGPHIAGWIQAVGEIEALESLASYAFERPDAVFPEIVEGGPQFAAQKLAHPLLSAPERVANDVRLDGSQRLLLVSGSNMSGKSTLLRAVGLNTVFAWAGAPVCAARLKISPLAVGASLRSVDSLQDRRSRFYAEITRLRQIKDLMAGPLPVFFLLDELLSGTNSHDRRIGAEGLLRAFVARGAIGLATTHDLALTHIADALGPVAANIHFEDFLEDGKIRFDYRVRPGVTQHSNALALMRSIGLDV